MRREVGISVRYDQWSVVIKDTPHRYIFLECLWDRLCWLTRGWLGGHGKFPAFFYRIPTGPAKWDMSDPDGPWLENNLPAAFMELENWVLFLGEYRGKVKEVAKIPVDKEIARKISPDFVGTFDDDHEQG